MHVLCEYVMELGEEPVPRLIIQCITTRNKSYIYIYNAMGQLRAKVNTKKYFFRRLFAL